MALLAPQFAYPKTGGVGPHARKLAEALVALGDSVLILSEGPVEARVYPTVESVGLRWNFTAALRAFKRLRTFRASLLLIEYTPFNFGPRSFAPMVIALLARMIRIRVSVFVHEIFYETGSAAVNSPIKACYLMLRDKLMLLCAQRIFVANAKKRQHILDVATFVDPAVVDILPIGANIEPALGGAWSALDADQSIIMSFGVVMPRRRFELIIAALAHLIRHGRDLRLRLVGSIFDKQYAERCMRFAAEHGVADRVILTGALRDEDVSEEFRRAYVYAYALEDGVISSSGSLLAAFAHGIPIAALATTADEVDLKACVASASNDDELAGVIATILDDTSKGDSLGHAARALYEDRFKWETIAASLRRASLSDSGSALAPRKLRVAFVDQSGDEIGGAERSLQLLIEKLPPTIDTRVLLFCDGAYARELRESGINVTIIPLPNALMTAKREGFQPHVVLQAILAVKRIRHVLLRLEVDVVYTNTIKAHFLAGMAARLAGIRSIAHLRDILLGFARWGLAATLRGTSSERIAISSAVAQAYSLPRTVVVPNPLNLERYRDVPSRFEARNVLGLPSGVPIVGIVGRINRWKGQDRFLRAAAILVSKGSTAHFAIVGAPVFRDSDFNGELKLLTGDLNLSDRVHFVPWLKDPRLAYAALDIHCNASIREPFGRTIIEAAAMGVPTISFDDGGAADATSPELQGDIVPAGDIAAFASAISCYLNDEHRLERAGNKARAYSATFDSSLHAARIVEILERQRQNGKRNR